MGVGVGVHVCKESAQSTRTHAPTHIICTHMYIYIQTHTYIYNVHIERTHPGDSRSPSPPPPRSPPPPACTPPSRSPCLFVNVDLCGWRCVRVMLLLCDRVCLCFFICLCVHMCVLRCVDPSQIKRHRFQDALPSEAAATPPVVGSVRIGPVPHSTHSRDACLFSLIYAG